ncbi:MAG TPA: site-specific integrase [Nitrospirota bacterium]|nr:site-specific integrase [Nitrospirota bacterium]
MENWYEKSIKALQLNGMAERTQDAYARSVRMLVEHFNKTPDVITEEELQEYFLHRKNACKWSSNTMRICYSGIKFFFVNVLRRNWHLLDIIRAQTEHRLPTVLSTEEVRGIFAKVTSLPNHAFLSTVYACGLRLQEARYLEVADIDSSRMMIHVHRGKGAKDRMVPLPQATLALLRKHWATHKNPRLIFPALGRNNKKGSDGQTPVAVSTVQGALRSAKKAAGIQKRGVSVHTLRHSYATHLLEAGVNLRVIQRYMGHSRLETTMIYLHLTTKGQEDAYKIIDQLMAGV